MKGVCNYRQHATKGSKAVKRSTHKPKQAIRAERAERIGHQPSDLSTIRRKLSPSNVSEWADTSTATSQSAATMYPSS